MPAKKKPAKVKSSSRAKGGKSLVIVESPTKAKTIGRFLGGEFTVESSYGHVRDLPKSKMGVDIEHGFAPQYLVPLRARKVVTNLKKLAAGAGQVLLATDEDREGESIAWHLAQLLELDPAKAKRLVFHEITETAIREALERTRALDLRLVDAQQARRVLDRLVGYELSPFLWRKIYKGLSAGRVQSVAVRLIVEREREINAFKPQEYWTIEGIFNVRALLAAPRVRAPLGAPDANQIINAELRQIASQSLDKFAIANGPQAQDLVAQIKTHQYQVSAVERKETRRSPKPPYTTSTLQQDANNRLGFSAKQTMALAQQLYEGVNLGGGQVGLITYMRTDAVNLAEKFINEARDFIVKMWGQAGVPAEVRRYKTKAKGAQEAHEAIRPTDPSRTPDSVKSHLEPNQHKLYELIWQRALASQMSDAVMDNTGIDIAPKDNAYTFRATGSVLKFPGYLSVYPDRITENQLPTVEQGQPLTLAEVKPEQHFTEPPPRYNEASLVKALEELGIGRPSTYAPTISTIIERQYVEKLDRQLKPTEIGLLVNDLLVEHFPEVVDYQFTARVEEDLDRIAEGEIGWVPVIEGFYTPFKKHLMEKETTVTRQGISEEATDYKCEKCGQPMIIKWGRFGKFLACTGYPECRNTKQLNEKGEVEEPEVITETCPNCGKPLALKRGRFGSFYGCTGYPDCKYIKKKEQSTGVTCPQCQQGAIVAKRSKFGKSFYSCNRYPDCKFAVWSYPTGEKCEQCGSLMVKGKNDTVICSNKECPKSKVAVAAST